MWDNSHQKPAGQGRKRPTTLLYPIGLLKCCGGSRPLCLEMRCVWVMWAATLVRVAGNNKEARRGTCRHDTAKNRWYSIVTFRTSTRKGAKSRTMGKLSVLRGAVLLEACRAGDVEATGGVWPSSTQQLPLALLAAVEWQWSSSSWSKLPPRAMRKHTRTCQTATISREMYSKGM